MQFCIISPLNGLCLRLFILKYWQGKNQPFALTVFWYYFTYRMASQCCTETETIKSVLLHLYPNFPIALTGLVNPHWISLYLLTLPPPSSLHSFIWHMFLITTGKTRLGLRRKIVLKLKSNEVIDKTSGGPRAMTCNPALIPHQIFSSLPSQGEVEPGPGGNWSEEICLPDYLPDIWWAL